MLERRGAAGSTLAFLLVFLGTLAAARAVGVGLLDGSLSSTLVLGAAFVLALTAATAVLLLLRRHGLRPTGRRSARLLMWRLVLRRSSAPVLTVVTGRLFDAKAAMPDVDELVRMLDDAVLLSQDVPVALRFQPVELTGLISGEIAVHSHPAERLTLAGTPPEIFTPADPVALARVVRILISNALSSGSHAVVRIDHGTTAVVVHVDDNGLGIPKSERTAVFERAYHMETWPSQRANHCAELVIARQIARLHGGDIGVAASPEGGARFTLHLPLLLAQEDALQIAS